MNRHAYNGTANGALPMSPTMVEHRGSSFPIRADKYDRYQPKPARSAFQRRRGLFTRVGGAAAVFLLVLMVFFPSLRPTAIIPALSLGLLGTGGEAFQLETVRYYDLANVGGTSRGWEREERILLCAPLRDAASHLPMFFSHLRNLTYPHNLIDLGFLVGDSDDNTITLLTDLLEELQQNPDPKETFGEISVMEKDFGQTVQQDVESRHGFAAQASRRKSMAQARNWLLSAALRPTHSWVYWRDVDVETAPFTILEDLMRHNKDIIVPNVWRPLPDWLGGEQPYDLNSWQESETALALADTLDEDAVIVEGYAEYATWRPHLAYLRDPYGDPDMEMEIDGVGGVSILAKARVFRSGVHFPAFSFEKHAETEGFGKMAKRMQFSVVGLPHYTVWHMYEPSVDDVRHIEEMEAERKQREEEERQRKRRQELIDVQYDTAIDNGQWARDKEALQREQEAADARAKAAGKGVAKAKADATLDKDEVKAKPKPAAKGDELKVQPNADAEDVNVKVEPKPDAEEDDIRAKAKAKARPAKDDIKVLPETMLDDEVKARPKVAINEEEEEEADAATKKIVLSDEDFDETEASSSSKITVDLTEDEEGELVEIPSSKKKAKTPDAEHLIDQIGSSTSNNDILDEDDLLLAKGKSFLETKDDLDIRRDHGSVRVKPDAKKIADTAGSA